MLEIGELGRDLTLSYISYIFSIVYKIQKGVSDEKICRS